MLLGEYLRVSCLGPIQDQDRRVHVAWGTPHSDVNRMDMGWSNVWGKVWGVWEPVRTLGIISIGVHGFVGRQRRRF